MSLPIEGGCLCGEVRFRLHALPEGLGDCHCVDCRRASAAPFVTWGTVPRAQLEMVRGEVKTIPHAERWRSFAPCCGTSLFFAETPESTTVDVTVASFDEPGPYAPRHAIWTEDRIPWVRLDETKPIYRRSSREG